LEKKILGIITARGGSKRIPRKNVKLLAGKPLIAYTIIEAKKSEYINKLIVSTDDEEIAKISKEYSTEVPFMRPNELALDTTLSVDVLIHAVKFLEDNNIFSPDIIVLLEPTAPLRTVDDIDNGIQKHLETDADSVVGVIKGDNRHPLKAKIIDDDKLKDYIFEEKEILRSQDLPSVYFRNGAFYSVKKEVLINERTLYGEDTRPLIMNEINSFDINSDIDFKLAEIIIQNQENFK
jgi:CMP-N-acetylneuraminic acid synthetase